MSGDPVVKNWLDGISIENYPPFFFKRSDKIGL